MNELHRAENFIKTIYFNVLQEMLNTKVNPLLTAIEQTSSDVWGKDVIVNAKSKLVCGLTRLYTSLTLSEKLIQIGSNSTGNFMTVFNNQIETMLDESKFLISRELFADGTGRLCPILDKSGVFVFVEAESKLLEGELVDLYKGEELIEKDIKILSISDDDEAGESTSHQKRKILRLNREINFEKGQQLYVAGSRFNQGLIGLSAIFEADKLYGLDKKENLFLNPYSVTCDSFNPLKIQEVIDTLEEKENSQIDFIVCSYDIKREYLRYMQDLGISIDIIELPHGYKAVSFYGIPLVCDRFMRHNEMYLLNTKLFKLHQLCDWRCFESESGRILTKEPNSENYVAGFVKYCQLVCSKPRGLAKLTFNL